MPVEGVVSREPARARRLRPANAVGHDPLLRGRVSLWSLPRGLVRVLPGARRVPPGDRAPVAPRDALDAQVPLGAARRPHRRPPDVDRRLPARHGGPPRPPPALRRGASRARLLGRPLPLHARVRDAGHRDRRPHDRFPPGKRGRRRERDPRLGLPGRSDRERGRDRAGRRRFRLGAPLDRRGGPARRSLARRAASAGRARRLQRRAAGSLRRSSTGPRGRARPRRSRSCSSTSWGTRRSPR